MSTSDTPSPAETERTPFEEWWASVTRFVHIETSADRHAKAMARRAWDEAMRASQERERRLELVADRARRILPSIEPCGPEDPWLEQLTDALAALDASAANPTSEAG
jgi:hypothetical protein